MNEEENAAENEATKSELENPGENEEQETTQSDSVLSEQETSPDAVETVVMSRVDDSQQEQDAASGQDSEAAGEKAQDEPEFDPFAPSTPEVVAPVAYAATELDNIQAAPGASEEEQPKKKRHIVRNLVITLVVLLVVAAGVCCGLLYMDDQEQIKHVPQNTTLDGVTDISGMSEAEVESVANKHVVAGTIPTVTLKVQDKTYNITYASVGSADPDATAKAALALNNPDMVSRCIQRAKEVIGIAEQPAANNITTVCTIDDKKLKAKIKQIAEGVDTDCVNASYEYSSAKNGLVSTKAQTGLKLNVKKTVKDFKKAAESGKTDATVEATVKVTEPEQKELGQAIFVDTVGCELYLYENGKVTVTYPCTPGMSGGYETPTGDWYLEYKDPSPTWYNPHSSWSEGMAETIAPGPNNPLGLRALALSCGGGIFIHGTTNYSQLGSRGSHGCIRLANENVVKLYDMVEEGIPIIVR